MTRSLTQFNHINDCMYLLIFFCIYYDVKSIRQKIQINMIENISFSKISSLETRASKMSKEIPCKRHFQNGYQGYFYVEFTFTCDDVTQRS